MLSGLTEVMVKEAPSRLDPTYGEWLARDWLNILDSGCVDCRAACRFERRGDREKQPIDVAAGRGVAEGRTMTAFRNLRFHHVTVVSRKAQRAVGFDGSYPGCGFSRGPARSTTRRRSGSLPATARDDRGPRWRFGHSGLAERRVRGGVGCTTSRAVPRPPPAS